MKRKNKGVSALVAVLAIGIMLTGTVAAFGGFKDEDVIDALESDDYDAWRIAMQDGLTEERFDQMQERYAKGAEDKEYRDAMKAEIEEGDYEGWLEVIDSMDRIPRMAENILDEEDFNTLVELHEARTIGDLESAKALAEELGLEPMMRGRSGRGMGHPKMNGECDMQ